MNEKLLPEQKGKRSSRPTTEPESNTNSPTTSSDNSSRLQTKSPRRRLNVSGPVKAYNPCLKNFWYPVAFTTDLKEDMMVILCIYIFFHGHICHIIITYIVFMIRPFNLCILNFDYLIK